ncbi:hypothetical protein BVRB_3g052470 [Beta vulgaris subsp. vulgaris]|nr:hypothetical protein BVRB_3g052470 [Beta vulgaris subsp. vulgaris]
MENNNNVNDSSPKGLVNELVEGRDLTKELQLILSNEPRSSTNEAYGLMAKKILAKFESSIQILHCDPMNHFQFQRATDDSPNSFSGSPKSQDSDGDFKDLDHKDDSKKRRISPRITHRVQGSTSSGLEGPVEDGYNWRKYGQKDILGAKFPRAYYRCTHRLLQGCLATKQVQRSDDDPSFFEVTYRGKHTCSQASSSSSPSSYPNNLKLKLEPIETLAYPSQSQEPHKIIWDFKRDNNTNIVKDIKPIITNNTNVNNLKSSSFSFPSSPAIPLFDRSTHHQTSTTMRNCSDTFVIGNGNFSYTYHNNTHNIDHSQGALLQDVVHPSSTSATNSPVIASELSFDHQGEFDDDFIFDNQPFFQ